MKLYWRTRRHDIVLAGTLAIIVFLGFFANLRSIPAGDTYAARYLPFSILHNHSLVLDPIVDTVAQGRRLPKVHGRSDSAYWIWLGRENHFISLYPITLPLVIAPLYLPAVVYLDAHRWDPLLFDRVARIMEKVSATLIATASTVLLYFLLRRRSNARTAMSLALVYAFGTTTWVISSQALWQHGLAQLLIVATLLLLTGMRTPMRIAAVGCLCALIAATRPPDAILAAGLGFYGLWWAGRKFPLLVASALLPAGLLLTYNLLIVGHIAGAYGLHVKPDNISAHFNSSFLEGTAGLLLSPTRGLFIFSPFLLFIPLYFGLALRDPKHRLLTVAISMAILVQLVGYGMIDWRQGASWGPRWLTDMLPLLMWMLPPIVTALSRPALTVFGIACGVSIAIQCVGAFWYTGTSDTALLIASAQAKDKTAPYWDVRNAAFITELQHPRAPANLFIEIQGSTDLIKTVAAEARETEERQVEIHGWALADGRTPTSVEARIDGRVVAGTDRLFTRPDVAKALGIDSPAGWKISFPMGLLEAGKHVLTIMVHTDNRTEPRMLREHSFTLETDSPPKDPGQQLTESARRAVQVLAERQQGTGYWLTSYTSGTRFKQPRVEMNTFTNAMMLDIAGPVVHVAGMEKMLNRARDFLRKQIEAGGLVRYHGLPDAPTMGVLGCAITPDTDDTALVWRVAPGEDRLLLQKALKSINAFRRTDGLYQTWLSPQNRYQCIDPGRDPNPADIGIQMNLFMLLAQEDPAAARALCQAIERKSGDEDFRVYYSKAPLLLILRQADLRAAGCKLHLPPAALESTVPGQAVWVELARILQRPKTAADSHVSNEEMAVLLRQIAANNFSVLTTSPPLIYHNDLTATVRRFYWSPEIGYAMWLRLYYEYEKKRPSEQPACAGSSATQPCRNH